MRKAHADNLPPIWVHSLFQVAGHRQHQHTNSRYERDWYVAIHRETPATHAAHLGRRSVSGLPAYARGSRGHCFADPWRRSGWRHQSAGTGQVADPAWTQPAAIYAVSLLALGSGTPELRYIPLDWDIGHE